MNKGNSDPLGNFLGDEPPEEELRVNHKFARKFDAERVNVVSGFRSPKYNLVLQKKGRNVARRSQHMEGHAVDFRIPGVSIRTLLVR